MGMLWTSGCMTRVHKRPVEVAGQLAYEEFKIRVPVFMDSSAASVTGELKDGDYQYSVGATDLSVLSDEAFVSELNGIVSEAVSRAIGLSD
jgi:hypothetical protein